MLTKSEPSVTPSGVLVFHEVEWVGLAVLELVDVFLFFRFRSSTKLRIDIFKNHGESEEIAVILIRCLGGHYR